MSSPERRRQKQKEREDQWLRDSTERARRDGLSLYERIEESGASESVKEILHILAEKHEDYYK
jgi:hypothetical protein